MTSQLTHFILSKLSFSKLILLIFIITSATSCQTEKKEATDQMPETLSLAPSVQDEDLNSDQKQLLEKVIGNTSGGTIRGIAFGDDISKVKSTETFEIFEDAADHIGFTSETEKLESIDVLYFMSSDKKVSKIQVDVYLNSAEATKQLWDASKLYFTDHYGPHSDDDKAMSWNNLTTNVTVKDASAGKDFGLMFQFSPASKKVIAAK